MPASQINKPIFCLNENGDGGVCSTNYHPRVTFSYMNVLMMMISSVGKQEACVHNLCTPT